MRSRTAGTERMLAALAASAACLAAGLPAEGAPGREGDGEWVRALMALRARHRSPESDVYSEIRANAKFGNWHVTEPLPAPGFAQELFPEKGVDLAAKDEGGRALWREAPEYKDGDVHGLRTRDNASTYLFRTITCSKPVRFTGYFGSDDGIAVWVNGRRILSKNVTRGVAPDQERAEIELRQGENQMLLKIHNGGGGHGFYFSHMPKSDSPGEGGIWAEVSRRFPVEWHWTLQDGGPAFLSWPGATDVEIEKAMIGRALEELDGDGAALRGKLRRLEAARTSPDDPAWLELYAEACEARRAKRLAPMLEKWKRIVFTKHWNIGGSHYAYTEAVSDARHERNFRAGSALCMMEMEGTRAKVRTLIEDPNGVLRDPDISYDGKRILFAWKKSDRGDDYHLYEMDVETEKVRQLTEGLGFADYEGCYLPNDDIMFNSTRCEQTVDCWWTRVSNLFLCDSDGKHMRRIGFDQVHTNYPKVMDDGRVTYTRWDYNDRGQLYPQPLFQMNVDGTAQTEFYGNNSWFPTTIAHARGIPGTGKVLAIATGHHSLQRGKICVVDPSKGRQENQGVHFVAPVREAKAEIIDSYGQSGELWEYPYPLNEREFLVTYAPGNQRDRNERFGIFFMDVDARRELLAWDPEISCNQPVPLAPRQKPHLRPSAVDFRKRTGTFYVQDVYVGPGLEGIPRGTVKRLRVVALDFRAAGIGSNGNGGPGGGALVSTPVAINNGSWDVKIVLGTTPVYDDGSASFEVPARTPLYFQLLDAKNHVVQTMRSWSTLQPGESFSCVGCHENKNNTPMRMKAAIAMRKGARPLEPFYGPPRGFSFIKEIQPILDKHCIRCHKDRTKSMTGAAPSGGGGGGGYINLDISKTKPLVTIEGDWRYTIEKPGKDWTKPDFDDSGWKAGKAGFGTRGTPGGRVFTDWRTGEIWMRTAVKLPGRMADRKLALWVCHDEDVDIHLNGALAASAGGFITSYKALPVRENAACTLQPGANVLAVHCRQTGGGQYIDVSFVDAGPAERPEDAPRKRPAAAVGAKLAYSLLGESGDFKAGGRHWTDSYLALTQRGRPNRVVNWMNVQSIPPMIPPYFAGAAKSDLVKMFEEGHNGVELSQEEKDKIACWIDLVVPFCGDYMEANSWSESDRAWYLRYLNKRRQQEETEREGLEDLIKGQTGKHFNLPPTPAALLLAQYTGQKRGAAGSGDGGGTYRNVALNPYDVQGDAIGYPHASSNSEYANSPDFAAKNAINGRTENKGHGGNFPSWGPDRRTDLWWKVEFGRAVEVDKIVLYIRADFPHDRHWRSATVEFSDGTKQKVSISKTDAAQTFKFAKRKAEWLRFTDLVQDEPLGWCGLSEVEVWGRDVDAK